MHRKSIEAADKLKDCDSDGESCGQHSEHSCSGTHSNASANSISNKLGMNVNERMNMNLSPPITSITSHSSPSSAAVIYSPIVNSVSHGISGGKGSFKEELRTSSIAALRAKAMEHSAKVHTLVASNTNRPNENTLFVQASPSQSANNTQTPAVNAHFHQNNSPSSQSTRPAVY